jgi:hypothetical protein
VTPSLRLAVVLALVLPYGMLSAQESTVRRCNIVLLRSDRESVRDVPVAGNENLFAGGNVEIRCAQQEIFIGADSVASFNRDVIQFMTRAYFRDEEVDITADTLLYTRMDERVQARSNVVAVNRLNGTTVTGPWLDHYRAAPGIRDSSETNARDRPKLTHAVARAPGDTVDPSPYVIDADRLVARGSSLMEAFGEVVITRDSLRGTGDSAVYRTGENRSATLRGGQAMLVRSGPDSFAVTGNEVELGFDEVADELDAVSAWGDGRVTNGTADVVGDSVSLALTDGKLTQTLAWDRRRLARVLAQGYDIRGDSIAIDTPGEQLREMRVFANGVVRSPETDSMAVERDSTARQSADQSIRDQMTGDRITARFIDADSAGVRQTQLLEMIAIGHATSLTSREVEREGQMEPTINYTRADTIIVKMKTGVAPGVDEVQAFRGQEPVDGIQLERARPGGTTLPRLPGAARPAGRP